MLELKGLSYQVEDNGVKTEILRGIDLTIEDNKFVVITGPNGGGKTTLAKIIMGLVKPTGGQILSGTARISPDLGITERAQSGHQLRLPAAPPVQGADGAGPAGPWPPGNEKLIQGPVLPVPDQGGPVRQRLPGPGGGRLPLRRRGQAHRDRHHPGPAAASLMIFDEPEAGIDLWTFARLTETFQHDPRQPGPHTMIIISHQERIIDLADEIVVICDGARCVHHGTPGGDHAPHSGGHGWACASSYSRTARTAGNRRRVNP